MRRIIGTFLIIGVAGLIFSAVLVVTSPPSHAQLLPRVAPQPGTAPSQPGQVTAPGQIITPQVQSPSGPTSGLPANVLIPATTTRLAPSTGSTLGGAGRGLPGMAGGPPLNAPMGAQDPTASYMRPPAVGPLFCDPAVDMVC